MKKLLLATTAAVALNAGVAGAADLRLPAKSPTAVARDCAADKFRGGYIGVHGGGLNWTANRTDPLGVFIVDSNTVVQKDWGWLAGAQAGYNWTTCNTVWGVEIDGSWVNAKQTLNFSPFGDFDGFTTKWDALVTARTRAGLVLDNLLLYLTGGFAAARFRTSYVDGVDGLTIKDWRWGWTAGFGTEYAFSPNLTIKFETLYVDFVDKKYSTLVAGGPPFPVTVIHSDSAWISRVGLNWKFGGGGPVVARN